MNKSNKVAYMGNAGIGLEAAKRVSNAFLSGVRCRLDYTLIGYLNAAKYMQDILDQPTMAANMLRDEILETDLVKLDELKNLALDESIELKDVWMESCFRAYI